MTHLTGPDGLPPYDEQPVLLPEPPAGLPAPPGRPRSRKKQRRNFRVARLPLAPLTRAAVVIMAVAAVGVHIGVIAGAWPGRWAIWFPAISVAPRGQWATIPGEFWRNRDEKDHLYDVRLS